MNPAILYGIPLSECQHSTKICQSISRKVESDELNFL